MTSEKKLRRVEVRSGIFIWLPDRLDNLATYVFLEQEDWFEDELNFVRRYLREGMRAADIGAAYGAYCLNMAKAVGPTGRVWAYEPVSATADCLERSAAENRLTCLEIVRAAISDRSGDGAIQLFGNAEYSSLLRHGQPALEGAVANEAVTLVRLDEESHQRDFGELDFIKIDAEGEERAIIDGSADFFAAGSTPRPLVMMEMTADENRSNLDLVSVMLSLGFRPFRHVRGLNVIAPFSGDAKNVESLNLFFCPIERIDELIARELLVEDEAAIIPPNGAWAGYVADKRWFDYQARVSPAIATFPNNTRDRIYADALDLYAVYETGRAGPNTIPLSLRLACLNACLERLTGLCDTSPTFARRLTLARVGHEASNVRQTHKGLSENLTELLEATTPIQIDEPFLLPSRRIEQAIADNRIPLDDVSMESLVTMAASATVETYELHRHLSSYFTNQEIDPLLRLVQSLPYRSAEIERRLLLKTATLIDTIQPSEVFAMLEEPVLNRDIWRTP